MIEQAGGAAHFYHTDVSKKDQVDRAFDAIKSDVGPFDVLFNHAGTIIVKPLLKWSCFLGQVCGLAKMHLVCVHCPSSGFLGPKAA
jgi:hypothetical protein